jgi:hypothetical protein
MAPEFVKRMDRSNDDHEGEASLSRLPARQEQYKNLQAVSLRHFTRG